MKAARVLQICVMTMVSLGALLLGMEQSRWVLFVLAMPAAVVSFYATDLYERFALNQKTANLIAIVAMVFTVFNFVKGTDEQQLLTVANLLVYLQVILLFQKKHLRIYWQLIMLSLLQVVVSAALSMGFMFGFLLVLYLFVALATLTVFYFVRESTDFIQERDQGADKTNISGNTASGWEDGPLGPRLRENSRPDSVGGFVPNTAELVLGKGFKNILMSLGVATLGIASFIFLLWPRFTDSNWQNPREPTRNFTGFSQEIELNTIGSVQKSQETVMRYNLVNNWVDEPYMVNKDIYVRGAVLTKYEDGRWSHPVDWQKQAEPVQREEKASSRLVRQEIKLESTGNKALFGVAPTFRVAGTPGDIKVDLETNQLTRDQSRKNNRNRFSYRLGTTAFLGGQQLAIIPHYGRKRSTGLTRIYEDKFPVIKNIADQVVANNQFEADDRVKIGLALERHFTMSGLYRYTLDLMGNTRPDVDPIENFVANLREGHCQYFASALVLMLRSQNIPARMVVGYLGGEYNSMGNYYLVRELNAHAWVEIYVTKEHIDGIEKTEIEKDINADCSNGGWLRLDPTPAGQDIDLAYSSSTFLGRVNHFLDYIQMTWNDHILGLNATRQRENIYLPILQTVTTFRASVEEKGVWAAIVDELTVFRQREGASFWSGIPVVLLLMVFATIRYLLRLMWPWLRRTRRNAIERKTVQVPFYERFEKILKRHGLPRSAHQTPLEFARSVESKLAETPYCVDVAPVPRHVADAYYQVRYGGQKLPSERSSAIGKSLAELESVLRHNGRGT